MDAAAEADTDDGGDAGTHALAGAARCDIERIGARRDVEQQAGDDENGEVVGTEHEGLKSELAGS